MHRIARTPSGLRLGVGEPGRGAWVCGVECFDRAVAAQRLGRALRAGLSNDEVEALRAKLSG
jgi:predicted RNA-binding protein YlxR (DUF448 family)